MVFGPIKEKLFDAVLENVLLSSNPETDPLDVQGYRNINVNVDVVHATATTLTMTCSVRFVNSSDFFIVQRVDDSSIPYTSLDATWSKSLTGSASFAWRIPVDCAETKVSFTHSGATTDTISVSVRADAG